MRIRPERLSTILDSVYRAPLEPEIWPSTLELICDAFSSTDAGLVVMDKRDGSFPLAAVNPQSSAEGIVEYTTYYGRIDDLRARARLHPVGEVLDTSFFPPEQLRASECYNDFYTRWRLSHFVGSCIANDDRREATLVVYRGDQPGPYASEEVATMEALVPHIRRSLDLAARLAEGVSATRTLQAALDRLSQGVILLNDRGGITWMNEAASRIVAERDGIQASRGELLLDDGASLSILRKFLAALRRGDILESESARMLAGRPSGAAPYLVFASPLLYGADGDSPTAARGIVFITDPARTSTPPREQLASAYGLTPAESGLALALAEGSTLQQYAEARDVSVATARTQLKRILRKTDMHRQADLVRLLVGVSFPAR